jgi:hypothetical protein
MLLNYLDGYPETGDEGDIMRVSEFGRWFRFLSVVSLMLCGFSINTWATPSITLAPTAFAVGAGSDGTGTATFTGKGTSSSASTVNYTWEYWDGTQGSWLPLPIGAVSSTPSPLIGATVAISGNANPATAANGTTSTLTIYNVPASANGLLIEFVVSDSSTPVVGVNPATSASATLTVGVTWTPDGTLPSGGEAFERGVLLPTGSITGLSNVSILTIGGNNPETGTGVETINLNLNPGSNNGNADVWTAAGNTLPEQLVRPTTTLLATGDVLIVGGLLSNATDTNHVHIYTQATGAVFATAPIPTARDAHTASLLPTGSVVVAGGVDNGTILSDTEIYTPGGVGFGGAWTQGAPLNVARYDAVATTLADGRVLVTGGFNALGAVNSAEIYDPIQNTWTLTSSNGGTNMTTARVYHTATLLPNGDVLIAGGYNGTSLAPVNSAEIFNPSTNTFTALPSGLVTARDQATATLVIGGSSSAPTYQVLIAGGFTSTGATAASEYFNPTTGAFTATSPLITPRDSHGAWLVTDGDVVVAGGTTTGGGSTNTSEKFWDPNELPAPVPSTGIVLGGNVVAGQLLSATCGAWNGTTYVPQPGTQYAWSIVDGTNHQPVLPVFGVSGGATTVQYPNYVSSSSGYINGSANGPGDTSTIVFVVPIGEQGGTLQLSCLASSNLGIPALSAITSVNVAPGTLEGRTPEAEISNSDTGDLGNTISFTVTQGTPVTFTAEGILGEPSQYDYQFQYFNPASGWLNWGTSVTQSTTAVPSEDGIQVRALVANTYGTGISNVQTLYVVATPQNVTATPAASTITSTINNPAPYTYGSPGPVTLTCASSTKAGSQLSSDGTMDNTITYQWYENNTIIGGATNSTYSFGGPSTALAGGVYSFYCVVTNTLNSVPDSVTSPTVTVTVNSLASSVVIWNSTAGKAAIASNDSLTPTVLQGDTITFSTQLGGNQPYPAISQYQWQYFDPIGGWKNWGTAATQSYANAQPNADNMEVRVAVTNSVGTIYSGPTTPAIVGNQPTDPILYVVTTPSSVQVALTNTGDGGVATPSSAPIGQGNYAVLTATDTPEPGNTTTYTWYKVGDNPTPGGPDVALNINGATTGSLNVCGPLPAVPGAPGNTGGSLVFSSTAPTALETSFLAAQVNNVLTLQGACVADAGTFYAVASNSNTNASGPIPVITTSVLEPLQTPAPSYPSSAPSYYSNEVPLVVNVGTWAFTGNLDSPRYDAYSLLLVDTSHPPSGNVPFWVGGGLEAAGLPPVKSDDLYNPAGGTWTPGGGHTTYDHLEGTATTLPNGEQLIAGGTNGTGDGQIGLDIYEGGAAYTTSNASLSYPVTQQAAALVTDTQTTGPWAQTQSVLLAGGQNGSFSNFYSSALLYTPGTTPGTGDTVRTSSGSLSVARAGAAAVSLPGNRVLITGGQAAGGPVNAVDIYDGNASDWSSSSLYPTSLYTESGTAGDFFAGANASSTQLPLPLVYHTATLLNDGRVLIAGGETTGGVAQNELWIWDPAANSGAGGFYALGTELPGGLPIANPHAATLITARAKHNAILLENGSVLLFDGFGTSGSALTNAEVVNPNWVWSAAIPSASIPAISLNTARALASSTLLQNGDVVVAGGYTGTAALNTAEVFSALETYSFPPPTGLDLPIIGNLNDGVLSSNGYNVSAVATLTFTPLAPFSFNWVQGPLYYSGVEITNYSWNLPAGTVISGQGTPSFSFTPAIGTNTIELQLTDQWGITSTCNITIDYTGSSWNWSNNTCLTLL